MRRFRFFAPTTGGGTGGNPGTPPATPPVEPPADDPAGEGGGLTLEQVKAELAKVRREAASHRTKNAALEAAEATRKAAEMTDLEKAQAATKALEASVASAQNEAKQARAEVAITKAAAKAGLPAELAIRLLRGDVEFDANGQPTGVDEAIADLVKEHPQLIGNAGGNASGGAGPTGGTPANPARSRTAGTLTKADIEKMTPAEINERWPDVEKFLKQST